MSISTVGGINFSSTEAVNEYCLLLDTLTKYGNNPEGIPALHAAIKEMDEKSIQLLLKHGSSPNAKARVEVGSGILPLTALDYAAAYGDSHIVNLLINTGAKVDGQSIESAYGIGPAMSPLIHAVIHNNSETIKTLISQGADLHTKWGASPLAWALLFGSKEAAKTLIALGAKPDLNELISHGFGSNPTVNKLGATEVLLQAGYDPNAFWTGICSCMEDSFKLPMTKLLLQYGANVNYSIVNWGGHTPLFYVSGPAADFLKSHGAISK